ncbi:uncharacterized protein LOC111898912 [Lactuca sativa]|uniref:uncharacterized protein LOC111898912 n=1 Tax=Lactuca sativa TaxID=4236 RepID=UPI000CB9CEEB|nr:uncharacterized protein LOC111898912 [Lactuca sativa]
MMEIMSNFDHDNRNPRVLMHNALIVRRLSFSYHKLPKQLLKLSVLKLDGSSFGVEVSMNATVADLKLVLEEFFRFLPKEKRCIVSWSHVWGHFCLCYKGQKLLNDKAYIRRLGIKDGDQIKFVRHVTINYRPTRQQMIKNQSDELKQPSISSDDARNCDSIEEDEEGESMFIHGSKVANFLKGWFSYRKFRNSIV